MHLMMMMMMMIMIMMMVVVVVVNVLGKIVRELPLKHSAMILVKKNQCLIRKGEMLTLHYE